MFQFLENRFPTSTFYFDDRRATGIPKGFLHKCKSYIAGRFFKEKPLPLQKGFCLILSIHGPNEDKPGTSGKRWLELYRRIFEAFYEAAPESEIVHQGEVITVGQKEGARISFLVADSSNMPLDRQKKIVEQHFELWCGIIDRLSGKALTGTASVIIGEISSPDRNCGGPSTANKNSLEEAVKIISEIQPVFQERFPGRHFIFANEEASMMLFKRKLKIEVQGEAYYSPIYGEVYRSSVFRLKSLPLVKGSFE